MYIFNSTNSILHTQFQCGQKDLIPRHWCRSRSSLVISSPTLAPFLANTRCLSHSCALILAGTEMPAVTDCADLSVTDSQMLSL